MRVVTFGEIMLLLAPNGYERFFQNDQMQVNVEASPASFGVDAACVTKLPMDGGFPRNLGENWEPDCWLGRSSGNRQSCFEAVRRRRRSSTPVL